MARSVLLLGSSKNGSLLPNYFHKANINQSKYTYMGFLFSSNSKSNNSREVKGYDYCPYCGSDDIIKHNDGTHECNDCDMVW